MAFLRYAKSSIVKPKIFGGEWDRIRVASGNNRLDASLKQQAERILGESFTPDKYLLTHSTIVCSVDVDTPTNVKTGALQFEGEKINRRFADYVVKSDCDQYINNNLDCWSRGVLQKSYKSFIGAHNFVEHIQVEELSKGKIIDAVLRDIGDSLYVDILVATNKKHGDLVQQILSGQMNAMSMGCSVDYTICTKCGNVASDETEMCKHIKYEKGNVFYDEKGNKHRIAELCGHESEGDNGGVTFIEASWVATPAFKGAVARNTLDIQKVASQKSAFDFGDEEGGEEDGEEKKAPEPPKNPIDELEEQISKVVMDRIKTKLEKSLEDKPEEPKVDLTKSSIHENDSVIKEGNLNFENWTNSKYAQEEQPVKTLKDMSDEDIEILVSKVVNRLVDEENTKGKKKEANLKQKYFQHLKVAVDLSQSNESAIKNIAYVNTQYGIDIPNHLYRLAGYLGNTKQYNDVNTYLATADSISKKPLTSNEQNILVRLAKILSLK
ncbi:hypothetical protein EBU71_16515 [bacterium]|nr:hypothetical protein [Candidatus Elulimicrobium humile]